ncbi:hypothetical protein ON010_g18773 [Phytophthora cinnamomi]|nr:hypothetical protein ON010_g18773 [Phytophthora cinnamomi]
MFPNFTSLAQREQKRIDLVERTKRRVSDELGAMRAEDKRTLEERSIGQQSRPPQPRSDRKKRGEDDIEDLDKALKDPRLTLKYLNKSTSTKLDDDEAKYKLAWFIIENKAMLEANNLQKRITPILRDASPAVQKIVNWSATLEWFLTIVKKKGLSLVSNTEMANEKC